MGSGRRRPLSASTASGRLTFYDYSSAGGGDDGLIASSAAGRASIEVYTSAHAPIAYGMPFGLPPPVHRVKDYSVEFAWPAEPPSPRVATLVPALGAGADEGARLLSSSPEQASAAAAAAVPVAGTAEQPRGSLLFGLGGAASVAAVTSARAVEHRVLVEEEHLRLEYAMAALDAAGARTRRHWRRVSRLSEAEAWAGEDEGWGDDMEEADERIGGREGGWRAMGERLTGIHRECRWKLAGNEHEGQEPGRFRPVLQPVVSGADYAATPQGSLSESSTAGPQRSLSASAMSVEDVGMQLARKCSRYIVDIVKTDAQGDCGPADVDGGGDAGSVLSGGVGGGISPPTADDDVDNDDVWGVIGPLNPEMEIPSSFDDGGSALAAAAAAVAAAGKAEEDRDMGIGVVEEVSSTGESPAARLRREKEERRLVEERVRQTVAAVAANAGEGVVGGWAGGGRGGGPRVDLGPGAERWKRAVAVAAEAAALGATEAVVLVTPKGNRRGRLSLTDKVFFI